MIGKKLGHYTIVEKLGEGGMGVVYKARDTHLDRFVAVKVLPPERTSDPERKARFVREAKAASALQHPNIVHIYDISSEDGVDYIAMEYVAGKTLDQMIPSKGMRLSELLKIAIQITDALARAHSVGIVHRDLKPANVIVDEKGLVKVVDFGLAKLVEQEASEESHTAPMEAATKEGVIIGTVAYMSPEQAEGKKVDARSDIFSFGALLYEMSTGLRAFQGDSSLSTLAAVLHEEPKPISGSTSSDFIKTITRCLRKDPDRRWQSMADLRVAVLELIEESNSNPSPTSSQLVRQKPAILLWAASSALFVLMVAGWLFMKYSVPKLPPPNLVQISSYPGYELDPSFSPDGQQVAFCWNGDKEDNWDIYVKIVGETNALQLTRDPAAEYKPAWSPDGKKIAFRRYGPKKSDIWSVSPLGGEEHKISDLQTLGQISWAPDGRWLTVAGGISYRNVGQERGLFLVPGCYAAH